MALDPNIGSKFLDGNGLAAVIGKIKEWLGGKVDKQEGYTLSKNDFTDTLKNKLDGLSNYTLPRATKTDLGGVTVDDELSNTSTNPIQNKKIYEALGNKLDNSSIVDSLASDSTNQPLSARQGKALKAQIDAINTAVSGAGTGDMLSSVYDTDGDGIVDNAKNLDGHAASYFAVEGHNHNLSDLNGFSEIASDLATKDHTHKLEDLSDYDNFNDAMESLYTEVTANTLGVKEIKDTLLPQKASITYVDAQVGVVTEIASGKCKSYVFDTVAELDTWLQNGSNTAGLNTGDVFLIRAVNVPDYWWDKSTSQKCILETTKVNLDTLTTTDIQAILSGG